MMHARVQVAGRTDVGRKREMNQDQFLIADLSKSMLVQSTSLNLEPRTRLYGYPQSRVMLVADGMGGHQGGNRASALAVDYVVNKLLNDVHWFHRIDRDDESDFVEAMKSLVRSAHETIDRESKRSASLKGMGTTLTMAYVAWPKMFVLHVGDTRCYLIRDGEMRLLTRDHTMASQLVEQGNLARKDVERSPWSNVLWNALGGGGRDVVPELLSSTLEPGDILVLCSDGLNKHVDDEEIQNIVELEQDPQAACRSLIELANYRGGSDNVTVIVSKFGEPDVGPAKTMVSAQITLERILNDLEGYTPEDTGVEPTREYHVADTDPDNPK